MYPLNLILCVLRPESLKQRTAERFIVLKLDWLKTTPTWIFDLDGTLTVPKHDFSALRVRLGLDENDDILSVFDGVSLTRAAALRQLIADWEWAQVPNTEPAPGVDVLLSLLTRNLKEIALATLDEIGCRRYFSDDCVLGREDALAKPSPQGVLRCLEALNTGLPAVMVGDYIYDVQAGRAAGCKTILKADACDSDWLAYVDLRVGSLEELHVHLESNRIGRFIKD